jgi:hypothetical protein
MRAKGFTDADRSLHEAILVVRPPSDAGGVTPVHMLKDELEYHWSPAHGTAGRPDDGRVKLNTGAVSETLSRRTAYDSFFFTFSRSASMT